MDVVLLALSNGSVGVMTLIEATDVEAEIEKTLSAHPGVSCERWRFADVSELPVERDFRDAWVMDESGAVDHDMARARDVHRNRIRKVREPMFEALDTASLRAVETGDKEASGEIAARKERLRDAPAHPGIEAAQTVEELRAVWPFDDPRDGLDRVEEAEALGETDAEEDRGEQPDIYDDDELEVDTYAYDEPANHGGMMIERLDDDLGRRRNQVLAAITTEKLTRLSVAMDPSRADFLATRFADYQNAGALGLPIDEALAADYHAFQELRDRRDRITNYAMQLEQSALDGDMDRLSAMHAGLGDGWP